MRSVSQVSLTGMLTVALLLASAMPISAEPATGRGSDEAQEAEEEAPNPTIHLGCDRIVSEFDSDTALKPDRVVSLSVLAKELGTNVTWIERCLQAYGRRSKRSGYESAEGQEKRLESMEEDEVEETFPEDSEEQGATERPERAEKPRQFKLRSLPTPSLWEKETGEFDDLEGK